MVISKREQKKGNRTEAKGACMCSAILALLFLMQPSVAMVVFDFANKKDFSKAMRYLGKNLFVAKMRELFGAQAIENDGTFNASYKDLKTGNSLLHQTIGFGGNYIEYKRAIKAESFGVEICLTNLIPFLVKKLQADPFLENKEGKTAFELAIEPKTKSLLTSLERFQKKQGKIIWKDTTLVTALFESVFEQSKTEQARQRATEALQSAKSAAYIKGNWEAYQNLAKIHAPIALHLTLVTTYKNNQCVDTVFSFGKSKKRSLDLLN